ncbi:transcriptional corepressor of histone-like protein genes [Pleomassaria siparia CBS 279.74]|uniref:Histone transcription regulator 3 homolog n=1 Tax=Pleomassaria siparia CBS 279.74 TaxID=1314801 RepID=A0A6G1KHP2_9PLEO|nr:transcriptional corepressor of histone-like protein genes [Pleomassaria siparia CBS 279.74]
MSTFKALNVESDNESEDEIDNTKEIQIEEALKLYQTALKLHSEGPPSFDKAVEAYKALFDSEIFKYTESLSEYKRHELFGESLVFDGFQDDFDAGPVQLAGANESAPNTLPQILHLSYKNHGQFMLETMQHWIRQHPQMPMPESKAHIAGALAYFAEALDKEDTDLDLWIRTASVAAQIGSQRITRFCLEAVLDGDDEMIESILRLPGLEEEFAGQQLREVVGKLEDNLSLMQAPLSTMKRKKFSETLRNRLNPYPSVPLPSEYTAIQSSLLLARPPERIVLRPPKWDWAGVADAILHHNSSEQKGYLILPPGCSVTINVPPEAIVEESNSEGKTPLIEDVTNIAPQEESPQPGNEQEVVTAAALDVPVEQNTGDAGDITMEDQDNINTSKINDAGSATPQEVAPTQQSRKRSTDSAGLAENGDGPRPRGSKRLRGRESTAVEVAGPDLSKQLEDQLWPFVHADQCLFEVVNDIFEKLGVKGSSSPQKLRDLATSSAPSASPLEGIDRAACDMYTGLQFAGPMITRYFLGPETVELGASSRDAGLNAFLGHSKPSTFQACSKPILETQRLNNFAQYTNEEWLTVKEVALAWLEQLLFPNILPLPNDDQQGSRSSYMRYRWAEDLKRHVVNIMIDFDEFIYEQLVHRVSKLDASILEARSLCNEYQLSTYDEMQTDMVETLFELHLDIYSTVKHPKSGMNEITKTVHQDRLDRWAVLARDAMQLRSCCKTETSLDELALRHVWASVFQMNLNDEIQPEHIIYAMMELKSVFEPLDGKVIEVQNNAIMPELSVVAVDRELARINMKDFYFRVFDQDEKDPVATIERLEPILEPVQDDDRTDAARSEKDDNTPDSSTLETSTDGSFHMATSRPSPSQEMRLFLTSATVSSKLSLWQRLREAYDAIEYAPKVLTCYLRSIETIIEDFKSSENQESSEQDRHNALFKGLRIIDDMVVRVLEIVKNDKTAFDCLSYEHLQASMTSISELLRILSAANIYEDMLRVGQFNAARSDGLQPGTLVTIMTRLHDMQLRAWILQYHFLKEGISQSSSSFSTPADDQFEFLRHVHHATGVRGFCHLAGRQFLRMAKEEIIRLENVVDGHNYDNEFSQVLYDLYGLKMFVDPLDCQEYGSVPDLLEKKTATQLLPFIISQAEKINIRDLPKTDLKVTIDKVQGALGRPKTNEDIASNRKMLLSYFKSPINPISLFTCLKGMGSLTTKAVSAETALVPSTGWFFLMGNIALNKFRCQKRMTQGPIEDLHVAQAFFLQDLEYSVERWETWYRLAQANDTLLEESVSWNADKMNSNSADLVTSQRNAINCYAMAIACAVRDPTVGLQSVATVSQMYTDFGNRVYASSREPFNMAAFKLKEVEHKWFSGTTMYQQAPFNPLSVYTAWKFASVLFKRAISGRPDNWWNYYMLGKCYWKMCCINADAALSAAALGEPFPPIDGPTWEQVVDAFTSAIENLPEKRERGRDPVLEPHYKLVSIVHKLFHRKAIDHEQGVRMLRHTSYSQNIGSPENPDDWERYILAVLKALRAADKASWHHRIIARSAHVIYDDSNDMMVAHGAKHELTQQMFTKTMTVQVWKPEHERPGRHFVYTSRYTKFFVHLLDQTGDKANFEALARRVRRKQADFFEHSKLWQELCLRFLKFLRRVGKVPDGHEDAAFKAINHDEFSVQSARLEAWCQNPATENPVLDILRDVVDLKRLNNGLMKALLIDDLIGDTYGLLYTTIGPTLPPLPSEQPPPPQTLQGPPPLPLQHSLGMVPVSSLVQMQVDGPAEGPPNPNTPFGIYHPSQLMQAQQPPEPAPRSRTKAVGRREIQRKAEACAAKPVGLPPPQPTSMPIRSPSTGAHTQIPLPTRPSPEKTSCETMIGPSNDQLQVPNSGFTTADASVTNAESNGSAPGSLHDSADDESELSELDESEVQEIAQEIQNSRGHVGGSRPQAVNAVAKAFFPNLTANKENAESNTPGSSASGDPQATISLVDSRATIRVGDNVDIKFTTKAVRAFIKDVNDPLPKELKNNLLPRLREFRRRNRTKAVHGPLGHNIRAARGHNVQLSTEGTDDAEDAEDAETDEGPISFFF